jgi:pimeloyl-ACP methyl ester carboxylesterase
MKFSLVASLLTCSFAVLNCSANPTQDSRLPAQNQAAAKNIVIVHGAFADGSGWESVYRILTKDGYNVTIVQNPLVSLAADVTATQNALANQNGPVVLVGHSYGGAVITQAGDDPKVKSLVYVAAYVPDVGESVGDLLAQADKSVLAPPIVIDGKKGIALVDRAKFPEAFAADVSRRKAEFMAASQAPLGLAAVGTKITIAAWKVKPSYYIVSSDDQMIPPIDERKFATKANAVQTFEFKASHAVFISQPDKVAKVIEEAASH